MPTCASTFSLSHTFLLIISSPSESVQIRKKREAYYIRYRLCNAIDDDDLLQRKGDASTRVRLRAIQG